MKTFVRMVLYLLAFVVPIVVLAAFGYRSTVRLASRPAHWAVVPGAADTGTTRKAFDRTKPTVAIVLGEDQTEITDALIPYELFSASGAYNVYAVAPARRLRTLSGGLEVMPDYSYRELDSLLGKSADVVVLPAFTQVTSAANQPVLSWIRQQAGGGSFLLSICAGAEVFAATGLLDGRTATTHWGDIGRIEKLYPAVHWVRGVRYVEGEHYITSAGITSGMDAVLHYLATQNGALVAETVSRQVRYPSFAYVSSPAAEQYPATAGGLSPLVLMNVLFHWDHPTAGVLLYDGVDELELGSIFDTYAATYTTRLETVSHTRRFLVTRHGLQIVPRWDFEDVPVMSRMIVPGSDARRLAAEEARMWKATGNAAQPDFLHADTPDGFAFDAPLADLARRENIATAVLDAKRLEYRPGTLQTAGAGWPLWLTLRPLLFGLAGLTIAVMIGRRRRHPGH